MNVDSVRTPVVGFQLLVFLPVFNVATVVESADYCVASNGNDRASGTCREAGWACSLRGQSSRATGMRMDVRWTSVVRYSIDMN